VNVFARALLVRLLKKKKNEAEPLGKYAWGALARSGSEKGFKSLLVSPFVPDGQLVSAHCAGISSVTRGVS
jgi:hypothetical protein